MPPQALEAEQDIIGACILSAIGRSVCVQELNPEDFYADKHKEIFRTIAELDANGPVDMICLVDALKTRKKLDDVGGMSYLMTCANNCIHTDNPETSIQLVKQKSWRRRLERRLLEGLEKVRDETLPIDAAQSDVEGLVLRARSQTREDDDPTEWALEVETEAVLVEAGQEGRRRIKTGFKFLDETLRLWPKKLSVLAGGTSQGKSATAGAIATASALLLGQRTYLWSGEMDKTEIWERMCAAELNIPYANVQDRKLNADERRAMKEFSQRIKAAPLIVRDEAKSVADIRAECRYIAHTQGPIDLVIVDYLSLLKELNAEAEGQDRRDVRIGIIVWNLIQMAKELDCHVLLVHQLNRQKDMRATSRPRVSDLKDSSTIEQHAHNVCLVYLPQRDESLDDDQRAEYLKMLEFIIGKQRSGKVGSVWLTFDGEKQKVTSLHPSMWKKAPQPKKQGGGRG